LPHAFLSVGQGSHAEPCHLLLLLQYKGTLQLDDFASHSEPDEYVFTVTADAIGEIDKRVSA
jgi:hypothetical protein